MKQYYLSLAAEQDIEEIVIYLANESFTAAQLFLEKLFASFEKLAENPHLGHTRKDLTSLPVKFWTFKWHYLVIYKVSSPLEIVRVLSGYRNITALL